MRASVITAAELADVREVADMLPDRMSLELYSVHAPAFRASGAPGATIIAVRACPLTGVRYLAAGLPGMWRGKPS